MCIQDSEGIMTITPRSIVGVRVGFEALFTDYCIHSIDACIFENSDPIIELTLKGEISFLVAAEEPNIELIAGAAGLRQDFQDRRNQLCYISPLVSMIAPDFVHVIRVLAA